MKKRKMKDNYIQRSYDEGFCDGVHFAIGIIEASRQHHNLTIDAVVKTINCGKPKFIESDSK